MALQYSRARWQKHGATGVRCGAFHSYRHADEPVVRWRLRRLEGYRTPARIVGAHGRFGVIKPRLAAMFRDRDELPTAADLGSAIHEPLAADARSTPLYERDPGNGQRLLDPAQAEYRIGFVALQLAEIDPANFDWQKEKA